MQCEGSVVVPARLRGRRRRRGWAAGRADLEGSSRERGEDAGRSVCRRSNLWMIVCAGGEVAQKSRKQDEVGQRIRARFTTQKGDLRQSSERKKEKDSLLLTITSNMSPLHSLLLLLALRSFKKRPADSHYWDCAGRGIPGRRRTAFRLLQDLLQPLDCAPLWGAACVAVTHAI